MIRRFNVLFDDSVDFTDLVERRRPLGMHSAGHTYQVLRDIYFDAEDGALAERGLRLRLRSEARGHQVAQILVGAEVNLEGITQVQLIETPVVGGGLYSTLGGSSEVATRVREIVEIDALRPLAAMDIDRETRDVRVGRFGKATHRILFDEVIAHTPGGAREFLEVTVVEAGAGRTTLEEFARRIQSAYGIRPDGLDTVQRLHAALGGQKGAQRPEAPNEVRVGLMLMRDWDVALVQTPDGFQLPSATGSGEELAREFLKELRGPVAADSSDLDLVGFTTARRGGADLEVWLHQLAIDERRADLIWIPLMELMQRLGGPGLRNPHLVAAMLMLVRSETGLRMLREAPHRADAPRLLPLAPRDSNLEPGEAPDDFLDLELSILDFNQRVLELAEDEDIPILERFRFLSIFSSNLDEFFVVRVGRLKDEVAGVREAVDEDLSAEQLLDLIAVRVRAQIARQYFCLNQVLLPALASHGIRVVTWGELDEGQRSTLSAHFESEVFPRLTPLSLQTGPGRSFPRLASLGLGLAISLRREAGERSEFGYVPIPEDVDRFLPVPDSRDLIPLEEVIGANVSGLFPGAAVEAVHAFRATRIGDVALDEDNHGSLLARVADGVDARPFMPVIRLEIDGGMPREVRAHLLKSIRDDQPVDSATLTRSDVYEVAGPVDLSAISELADVDVQDGLFPAYEAADPLDSDRSIFEILSEREVLVHHPFQSFERTVGRFLREAAEDPDVVAVKLTLYRTGRRSPVMDALMSALERGKDVSVFVELTARFDEESNIHWTKRLEEAGAHVIYGVSGYKTHAKTALVIRKEQEGLARYVHIGTGNYNAATSRFYTDLGLMSADPDLGADLNDFFNELTGGAGPPGQQFRRLLVAPNSLVQGVDRMIAREIEHARAGRPARIQVKVNGLADRKVVERLYDAASEGVEVDLIVRSICTLRPDVPGLSEGVRVRSILGRFLEHARIYAFENGGDPDFYIGSADWRARNLRRRVEVVTPVTDAAGRAVLRSVLEAQLDDPRAWVLRSDGAFERLLGSGFDSQHRFMASGGEVAS